MLDSCANISIVNLRAERLRYPVVENSLCSAVVDARCGAWPAVPKAPMPPKWERRVSRASRALERFVAGRIEVASDDADLDDRLETLIVDPEFHRLQKDVFESVSFEAVRQVVSSQGPPQKLLRAAGARIPQSVRM